MSGGSLGSRASHGSSLSPPRSTIPRRPSTKMLVLSSKDRERILPVLWWYLVRRKVAMVIMAALALLVLIWGTVTWIMRILVCILFYPAAEDIADRISWITNGTGSGPPPFFPITPPSPHTPPPCQPRDSFSLLHHPCHSFKLPPSPPSNGRRIGPRPCPVCYVSPEQASVSMPCTPSESPVLRELTYVVDENPIKTEPHAGSDFAGYPSLNQRTDSFDIRESMTVHCGFVRGSKPGQQTGFDIDEADLVELEQPHEVIVASAIFGNYDIIQQPENISEAARKNVPFYMFIDEETEAFLKNTSVLDSSMRVGFWRIIVVRNIPYTDARRNGKIPKLLLHRILPNVRYSIWIDGKLQLVVDPYQVLERFLWREKANFAISRHYKRFDLFEEAEANKAAGKYDNASIDYQIDFYKKEGLTPYTEAKLPITSDVPEGCVIIREHVPITNLFTCLWFNEVDRFTARDQLSFSSVRDKIMEKVNWTVNMFLDCERRNFVIQRYHKDLLDRMPPPPAVPRTQQLPRPLRRDTSSSSAVTVRKNPSGKNPSKRGRDRRSGSRQHRKAAIGNRSKQVASKAMMQQY